MACARFNDDADDTAALLLVRFGAESAEELRSTRADRRSHFISDAEKSYGFLSMKVLREIPHLPRHLREAGTSIQWGYNEIHLSRRLPNFAIDISFVAGTPHPVHETVNAIPGEMGRGEPNPHPFRPYIVPNYHERPRISRIAPHVSAYNSCGAQAQ